MTDLEVVSTAVMVAVAAGLALAVPWWVVAVIALVAATVRHPAAVGALAVAAASTLGAGAEAGLTDGPVGPVLAWVALVTDPAPGSFAMSATGRLGDHLVLLEVADPTAAATVRPLLAGQRLLVRGTAHVIGEPTDWQRARHLSARLDVNSVLEVGPAGAVWGSANAVRRWLTEGAAALDADQRALFAGLVIGDDRDQSVIQQHAFRASGLAHLLAVSGQNVAFVLLVASPFTARLMLRSRSVAIVVVLGWFVVLTRFEPSVLRSVAMAAVATTSTLLGRRSSGLRVLGLAVAGVVLIDPLIVWSFGFRLSVGASLGLVLAARPLGRALRLPSDRALRLPRILAEPLGVTLAATAGTAPLLVSAFGILPVVSPVANLLAVPVAGAVMVWGMTAGVLAGLVPALAPALHLPTRLMLWWIDGVARACADPRSPRLTAVGVTLICTMVIAALLAERWWHRVYRHAALAIGSAVVAGLVVVGGVTGVEPGNSTIVRGADLAVSDDMVVLVVRPGVDGAGLLDALDTHGVSHLDAVVVTRQRTSSAAAVALIRRVYDAPIVVAPPGELIAGAQALGVPRIVAGLELRSCTGEIVVSLAASIGPQLPTCGAGRSP